MATAPTRPGDEIARLGREIYERDIRRQVEADHDGDYVAIDVDSGEWAVAGTETAALDRLREQRPAAIDVLMERVGYRALRSFGGYRQRVDVEDGGRVVIEARP
ncbi:MAG: hypothetical protein OXG38_11885 [Chloroflexi bacterium]|nr:hypothetical protein [Chloroflexota bacterium]